DAAAGAQDAAVQEPAVSPEISFHAGRRLQHVQCPTPSRLSPNAPRTSRSRHGNLTTPCDRDPQRLLVKSSDMVLILSAAKVRTSPPRTSWPQTRTVPPSARRITR